MKERIIQKFNYRHMICICITLAFFACTVLIFDNAIGRIAEAFKDFGLSVAYYFTELLGFEGLIEPTVNNSAKVPFFNVDISDWINNLFNNKGVVPPAVTPPAPPTAVLPSTWELFKVDAERYFKLLVDTENLNNYLHNITEVLKIVLLVVSLLLPLFISIKIQIRKIIEKNNNDYDSTSKALKMLQKVHIKTYLPLRNRVILFYTFLKNNIAYVAIWAFVWLLNFNIISIVVEFMAFYLYFAVSFDFISIYTQFCKLAIDLQPMFNTIPTVGWILMAVVFIYIWRKSYAMDKLLHNESKNKGFINERPIVLMLCGTMGSNKTKTATDMALSQEVMFREEAYKKIIENDLRFPYFTWITFENDIKKNMEEGKIFNLATCRAFIAEKKTVFETEENINNMWGYDYERYGLTHDNKLEIMSIWTVLENYVQLYFIYILESSLLITNYAIRTDNVIASVGNFPMWNTSFFKDSKKIDACSRHSHIIDYDTLRLGRRIVAEREDTFEFGVVVITEIGKERGNNLENIEVKKTEDTANQKNDMFNKTLKMIRHSATVDFFPFVKVIVDEQRPESWGADARDLCDIAYIQSVDKEKLALPLFFVEELVCDLFHNQFKVFYQEYRFNRADHIVLSRIMKVVGEKLYNYHKKTYNMYGYRRLVVGVEAGRQLGETKQNYYYLSNKKIHAKRYSTDCFADFFMQKSINNKIGLQKMKEYFSEKATLSELKEQNSYFMNDLLNKPTRPVKRVSDGRVAKKGTAVR